jgi:hypothetical protein
MAKRSNSGSNPSAGSSSQTPSQDKIALFDLFDLSDLDRLLDGDGEEFWDVNDSHEHAFWSEFLRLEEVLSESDDLDPPTFSVTIQNHQTGEVRTFKNIRLVATRKKIAC